MSAKSDSPLAAPVRPALHLLPAALFLFLSLVVTFPLWVAPASRIQSLGDPLLNAHLIWWAKFALFHQAWDFFQANFFWPFADSFAFGEHLISQMVLTLPFAPVTKSAVAMHNLSLVQASFFSALAAYALGFYFFRSIRAATIAGLAYGFASYRIAQSGHLQLLHGEFLPLMILAFERGLDTDARRWKWLLGVAALGQWLSSWYWAVFSFWFFVPYMGVRLWQRRQGLNAGKLAGIFAPLIVAVVCVAPIAWPSIDLRRKNITVRPEGTSDAFSARPGDFLAPPGRNLLYSQLGFTNSRIPAERRLFPGVVIAGAFALSIGLSIRKKRFVNQGEESDNRFAPRLWVAVTVMLLLFCFGRELAVGEGGTRIPMPYWTVSEFFPFAEGVRVAARWMLPASLGLAMCAAFAWQALFARRNSGGAIAAQICIGALLVLELWPRPMPYEEVPSAPPAVFRYLAEQPYPSPILELPIAEAANNLPMLHATWHGQPTVNGSNGFFPPGHIARIRKLQEFPNSNAIAELKEIGVRFVVVDLIGEADRKGTTMQGMEALLREGTGPTARLQRFDEFLLIDLMMGEGESD